MVRRILRALFYHYIKQRAKLISKKQDNSSQTTSSRKNLTMEPQGSTIVTSSIGTSEKIIMETQIEPVVQVRDWVIDRIESLHDQDRHKNAMALVAEFDEWLDIPEGTHEIDYLCIEDDGWTEKEIDTL
jgi:acyl-CoA hydrolase